MAAAAVMAAESSPLSFQAEYIGVVPVASSSLSEALWSMFGAQVVEEATKRLKALKPKKVAVSLDVSPMSLSVTDTKTNTVIDVEDVINLKYCTTHPSDKKKIVYIVLYPQVGLLYCHMLQFKSKPAAAMAAQTLQDCKKAAKSAEDEVFGFEGTYIHKMTQPAAYTTNPETSAVHSELVSSGQTMGIIESMRYIGTVPIKVKGAVTAEISAADVSAATEYMLGQLKAHADRNSVKEKRMSFVSRKTAADANPLLGLPVVLVITTEGMRTIDNISREETHKVFLQDLVYFAPVDLKKPAKGGELFASVSKDLRLRHVRLRLYRCSEKGQADLVCSKIRDAFAAANRADELRNGQPFMPMALLSTEIDSPLVAIEFDRGQITPIRPIGAGLVGLVFLVDYREPDSDARERAVKVLRPGATAETMADFLREAEILQRLDHTNVVKLHGVCLREKPWLLMEENIVYGDLDKVLKACSEKNVQLFDGELLSFSQQIVAGLGYVASVGIIHSDVAARNCLLHLRNQIKIADFGWSRELPAGKKLITRTQLPKISTRWLAPECIERMEFSEKSDVWATAVTIWECYSYGALPFEEVHFLQVARLVKDGLRLSRPPTCSHALFKILEKCWEHEPGKRPKFRELAKKLDGIKATSAPARDVGEVLAEAEADAVAASVARYQSTSSHDKDTSTGAAPAQASKESRPSSEFEGFGEDDETLAV
eukprot:m.260708 g.260708  ORF g.260708 m.260708 type:complete len:713 (+) comp15990_c0_seq17:83-2221(+)